MNGSLPEKVRRKISKIVITSDHDAVHERMIMAGLLRWLPPVADRCGACKGPCILTLPVLCIMDISFALTGKGYVIVAADTTAARSIVKMKLDEDKIKVLSPHLLMAYSGEPGAFSSPLTYTSRTEGVRTVVCR